MRFLIVDDDESIHLYLRAILAPHAQCYSAMTGEQGVELFDAAQADGQPYDVIMMDILMPGMDGHQAAETMRAREKSLGITELHQFQLVMITSLVDDTNVSKAFFNTQATCYIVKPLNKENVLDELRRNLII